MKSEIQEFKEMYSHMTKEVVKAAKEMRESEPRYSVTELEKIVEQVIEKTNWITKNTIKTTPAYAAKDAYRILIDVLKDRKEVGKILNAKESI